MTVYVLDASAGADLLLDTASGRSLVHQFESDAEWWVPEHYFVEVASVIRRAELGGGLTIAEATIALDRLDQAPLRRAQIRPLLKAAWRTRANLTVYDALYVVLAEHLDASLVTADLRLAHAPNLPVSTITPSLA